MASVVLQQWENFTTLLVNKGTEAFRNILDIIIPPVHLPTILNGKRKSLQLKLKFKVINGDQWDLLFPSSGNPPDSKTFDITLLANLLWYICGFRPPETGWNRIPLDADRSILANVVRVMLICSRHQFCDNVSSTQIDNTTFMKLWDELPRALFELGVSQKEIDDLKTLQSSLERKEKRRGKIKIFS